MKQQPNVFAEEKNYLNETLTILGHEINHEMTQLNKQTENLKGFNKEMWASTSNSTKNLGERIELSQYLEMFKTNNTTLNASKEKLTRFNHMKKKPYFGRIDFKENGSSERENLYIGLSNLIDSNHFDIKVYDWRAPISSIFYTENYGSVAYRAPDGLIEGELLLKRQFHIENGELKNYYDHQVSVGDDLLIDLLSQNSSQQMHQVAETIQMEQNAVVRNLEHDLLMVQGVPGSGKTIIALHRIAYLLYHGKTKGLSKDTLFILSPNDIFSTYISSVLPELGEENVHQNTFETLAHQHLIREIEPKSQYLERIMSGDTNLPLTSELKGSKPFLILLERWLNYYIKKLIPFADVYYHGKVILKKEEIKTLLLNNPHRRPTLRNLTYLERVIYRKIDLMRKERKNTIENVVMDYKNYTFNIEAGTRLIALKEQAMFSNQLNKFLNIDYDAVYTSMFDYPKVLKKLSDDLDLPHDFINLLEMSKGNLEDSFVHYEDTAPLLYLKSLVEGIESHKHIRHVVIDEAQDYSYMQYAWFNALFNRSNYTVLGDWNQTLGKKSDKNLYEDIHNSLNKESSIQLTLDKCYRSTYEISEFAKKILNSETESISYSRHGDVPETTLALSREHSLKLLTNKLDSLSSNGYGSTAILCKTLKEARFLYENLKNVTTVNLVDDEHIPNIHGTIIIPIYLAKGLEFDAVIIYDASAKQYNSKADQHLLYVGATRALHKLSLIAIGEFSPFVPDHRF